MSNFTFLHGASHPEELVVQATLLGYSAIAITDECSVAGVVRAYARIRQDQLPIKLIVGAYFTFQETLNITLLCTNRKAYAELCRVITNSRRRCEKGQYELTEWDLKSLQHCLILWHARGNVDEDKPWGDFLLKLNKSTQQRLWLAMTRTLESQEQHYIQECEQIALDLHLPIVACGQVLMHNPERLPLQHVLHATRIGTTVERLGRQSIANAERCLRPTKKLARLYRPEHILETLSIANRCVFDMGELKYEYPSELIPRTQTPTSYLRLLVEEGKKRRFPNGLKPELTALIEKELGLIKEMAYEHFFITIYDIVQYAKSQNILYQGRGSAANSVVCYCLEITSVDPSQINVLFERFISKERNEPPDIDVDFEHQRREEIFQYIYDKYGRNHAAIAATVVTYRMKSAIREVGKALGFNEVQLEFFIKHINRRDRTTHWIDQVVELGLNPKSLKAKQFVDLVEQIKGFPRHLSQHVGGFVISSGPLYELVPVENAAMAGRTVIQWDKDDLETLQLLKVDVLALGMLTAIRKSFDLIKTHYQRTLSIADITRTGDDPNVYKMISNADTIGVFQIESRAQMTMLPRLKPKCYYDLVIQIAIVRPGPIQGGMVHPYLKRRMGEEEVSYPSTAVQEVLSRTLGVPIFQEQVIKLAMVAAGFSGGEADQLRRAMAKWKKNGELTKFQTKLTDGMLARGYSADFADRIFKQICGFGEYGFPESHSASFAVLAYVSAWLKYYYPEAFFCALLNSLPMGFYSPSQLVQDAQRHNIRILPLCINHSVWDHQLCLDNGVLALRLGFRLVKGLRQPTVEKLAQYRMQLVNPRGASKNREMTNTRGFSHVGQLKQLSIPRNELEALASSNALKSISGDRFSSRWQMMDMEHELPLFSQIEDKQSLYSVTPSEFEELVEDYAAIGLSVDRHPISLLRQSGRLGRYTPAEELVNVKHKTPVTVIGLVTGKQSPGTASGVTFITLEDDTGNSNVVVWVATARAQKQSFLTAKILKVKGILEKEQQVTHVIAGKLIDLTPELEQLELNSREFR